MKIAALKCSPITSTDYIFANYIFANIIQINKENANIWEYEVGNNAIWQLCAFVKNQVQPKTRFCVFFSQKS